MYRSHWHGDSLWSSDHTVYSDVRTSNNGPHSRIRDLQSHL